MDIEYNDIYSHIVETDARVIVNYGGRDSGKSYFVGGQYFPMMMMQDGYFRGMVVKKTYTSCKDSVFKEITDGITVMEQDHNFNSLKSPLEIKCKNGNTTIFRGLDNPTNLKSIKGINCIWVEESEDLTEVEFENLMILLRGKGKQKIILTFNPIDEEHFTNGRFVKSKKDKVLETFEDGEPKVWEINISEKIDGELVGYKILVICSTYNDNAFIEPQRKLVIEKLKDTNPFLYEVYRRGKFGTRGGLILTNVEQVDFDEKKLNFRLFDNRGYSQDFGFNHYNAILSVAEKDNCLYVFDEIYVNEKTTSDILELADRKYLEKRLNMICDCAEPDKVIDWQRSGYNARGVKKYAGSVNDQINYLQKFDKIYINVKCVNTWKEARAWMWKQNKQGKFTDDPVDVFDDAMAALRYSKDLFSSSQGGIAWAKGKKRG